MTSSLLVARHWFYSATESHLNAAKNDVHYNKYIKIMPTLPDVALEQEVTLLWLESGQVSIYLDARSESHASMFDTDPDLDLSLSQNVQVLLVEHRLSLTSMTNIYIKFRQLHFKQRRLCS